MAAYSGCGERDGGLRHGERRSRTGMARVGGEVQLAGGRVSGRQAPSSRKWQGSQSSEGATELGFPGPALGKMQSEAARRAARDFYRRWRLHGTAGEPPELHAVGKVGHHNN